jgi:Flp pilus assembly protein TadD
MSVGFGPPWENALVTLDNARQMLAEAERALRHCPDDGATFAHAYKTVALRQLGRHQEAREAARQVPAMMTVIPQ